MTALVCRVACDRPGIGPKSHSFSELQEAEGGTARLGLGGEGLALPEAALHMFSFQHLPEDDDTTARHRRKRRRERAPGVVPTDLQPPQNKH